jgi:large subunit ribosomal protein L22
VSKAPAPELTVCAEAKWVRTSARKARLVLDHIRGRSVPEARTILAFTSRTAARDVDKVLRSAVANAESAHALDGDELIVVAAYADEGPTLKRWRARARGRVNRIRKRTCHITIVVAEDPNAERRRPRRQAKPAAEKAPKPAAAAPEVVEAEEVEPEEAEIEETAEEQTPKRRSPAKKEEVTA